MAELFEGSAATWVDKPGFENRVPADLAAASSLGLWRLIRTYPSRQRTRRALAQKGYDESRHPVRGLPIAENSSVVRFIARMIRDRRKVAIGLVVANCGAAIAGAAVPQMLGGIVDDVTTNVQSATVSAVTSMVVAVLAVILVQAVLTFVARRLATVFGQDAIAAAREYVIRAILKLPLSSVETASTGDLVTRVTRDVGSMGGMVRWAMPTFVISAMTLVFMMGGMVLNSWLLALPLVFTLVVMYIAIRRYLSTAHPGYIAEGAGYSKLNTSLTETVEGARTMEALRLQSRRVALVDNDIEMASQYERYTMGLRAVLFTWQGLASLLPMAMVVVIGYFGYGNDLVTLGQITAATVYLQQMNGPMDRVIMTINHMQIGAACTSRLLGIASVPQDRQSTSEEPEDTHLVGRDLTFAYREGRDVLHDVTLDLRRGERLAIVGPSGSGKSTLGRLLAGINAPRLGVVEVGGVDVMHLPLTRLRTEVALVTQEHHVFVGSIRDNVILAREDTDDDSVWDALRTVDAAEWVAR
ncbi:MAG: ABC transporter ATP-binding protein/permease, partial [Propionibacteriaceae bacterium]|nr:ABC transporter ATP-binding protein/permease [Propionibacteriaceae bacterium]